jgi:RNA polymerase sigma-70 factor (ECF subfamily)
MANAPKSESDLIQAAVAGDRAALQGLLLTHYKVIEATVRARFSPELAAHVEVEDLIQETLVKAHRGITLFRENEQGTFSAWLRSVAENCVIDAVRHFRRLKRGGGRGHINTSGGAVSESSEAIWEWVCADSDTPYRASRIKEVREMVQVCVAELKDEQRRAVVAHYFDHMDPDEIGKEMDRSSAAVRELLRRARKKLSELFGTASAWLSSR